MNCESLVVWFHSYPLCIYAFGTSLESMLTQVSSCIDYSTFLCMLTAHRVWCTLRTEPADLSCHHAALRCAVWGQVPADCWMNVLSPGPGKVGDGWWPSPMADVQPSTLCFWKTFDLNNLFFLFKGQFSAHHLVYFYVAKKIQWGSNFLEKNASLSNQNLLSALRPACPCKSQRPCSQLASPMFPARRPSLLHGFVSWQKQMKKQNCHDFPQLLQRGRP